MITAVVCALALFSPRQQRQAWAEFDLPETPNSLAKLYYLVGPEPLDPPGMSPKRFGTDKIQWEFPWLVAGCAHIKGDRALNELKFHVYAQEQKGGKAGQVARMLLRLWELNVEKLKIVHDPHYHDGRIDTYLCFGGKAGGEQLFDEVLEPDPVHKGKLMLSKVDTIYIYDTPSFTDPVEMAREVAHEYGHATWFPIGGFKEPEGWSDGYLAEKVFLRWIRDGMARGELTPDDAMGATKSGLDKWLADNADPLALKAAQTLPTSPILSDKSAAGMNAFIGLALYIETILPDATFSRSMQLCGFDAKDYAASVLLAAEELEEVTLKVPDKFFGHAIWVPVGKGKITGAKILKFDPSGWVQIEVRNTPIVLRNTRL